MSVVLQTPSKYMEVYFVQKRLSMHIVSFPVNQERPDAIELQIPEEALT